MFLHWVLCPLSKDQFGGKKNVRHWSIVDIVLSHKNTAILGLYGQWRVCTWTRKKQPIKTLLQLNTLFWLYNFWVRVRKSYLKILWVSDQAKRLICLWAYRQEYSSLPQILPYILSNRKEYQSPVSTSLVTQIHHK